MFTSKPSKKLLFSKLEKELYQLNKNCGIDLACGNGKNSSFFKTKKYIGLDLDKEQINQNKKIKKKNHFFFQYNILSNNTKFDNKGDIVVSTNTLGHLKTYQKITAIKKLISITKKNSDLFVELDKNQKLPKIESLLRKNFKKVNKYYYKNYINFFIENILMNKVSILNKIIIFFKINLILYLFEKITFDIKYLNKCVYFIAKRKLR
jgi:hypothetical protein